MAHVIVLSKREDTRTGVLYDGNMFLSDHDGGKESLAEAVLRTLREERIDIQDGDAMFFPDAHPEHRWMEVDGGGCIRLRTWGE